MNRALRFSFGVVVLLGTTLSMACATPVPPGREGADVSVIGISVGIHASGFGWWNHQASRVYFVRLDDSDHYAQTELIPSNYTSGEYVYLFNAQPGRYGVVAAGYVVESQGAPMGTSVGVGGGFSVSASVTPTHGNTFTTYFSPDQIEKTAVTARPSGVAYMGDVVLDRTDWEEADEVQRYYYDVLAPGHKDLNFLVKAFSGQRHDPGVERELDQSEATRRRFLTHSQPEFADTWEGIQ